MFTKLTQVFLCKLNSLGTEKEAQVRPCPIKELQESQMQVRSRKKRVFVRPKSKILEARIWMCLWVSKIDNSSSWIAFALFLPPNIDLWHFLESWYSAISCFDPFKAHFKSSFIPFRKIKCLCWVGGWRKQKKKFGGYRIIGQTQAHKLVSELHLQSKNFMWK